MKNRFNNLTSKEWLPFQKSWFHYTNDSDLYRDNINFFVKFDHEEYAPNVFFFSHEAMRMDSFQQVAAREGANLFTEATLDDVDHLQFAMFDVRNLLESPISLDDYLVKKQQLLTLIYRLKEKMVHRRFIAIMATQPYENGAYYPIAWDIARTIAPTYSLKDEKIGCLPEADNNTEASCHFRTSGNLFYALYLRKDENTSDEKSFDTTPYFKNNTSVSNGELKSPFPGWFILKPPPRKKNEILHPAKYPEDLVIRYLDVFTKPGDAVFDPMSGTGSTQVAALAQGRHGFGTELNAFFTDIANDRCKQVTQSLNPESANLKWSIKQKDARRIDSNDFPPFDYIITSPPYWDMLNMKGAEYQARRKEKGLQLNYSEDDSDLGNIDDYPRFLDELVSIYFSIIKFLKPGRYMTIIVKNVKKKGRNYPLAWDLSERLQERLILLPESFWLQDDISIAPYGYFNTFVSNTFHHYCLSFQKPLE